MDPWIRLHSPKPLGVEKLARIGRLAELERLIGDAR
jgi:hypothetical protein